MVRRARRYAFDVRVVYILAGIVVSLFAHELVHVLMHFGSINSVHFFPNINTIFAMNVDAVDGYNLNVEEAVAYGVTILIQFVTIIDVFAIHDSRNHKTAQQILFGNRTGVHEGDSAMLYNAVFK